MREADFAREADLSIYFTDRPLSHLCAREVDLSIDRSICGRGTWPLLHMASLAQIT